MMTLRPLTESLAFVRRNLIWFLICAFGLAALWPGPGDALRHVDFGELPFTRGQMNPTHLLLGVLLFCVGVSIRPEDSRNLWRLSRAVLWGTAGAWLVPVVCLALLHLLDPLASPFPGWEAFLTGAAVVIAMPPANSSSIWSEISGGQPAATVSIIILATLLSPLLTPLILGTFAGLRGTTGIGYAETAASLEILLAFVVLPAGMGIGVRSLCESISVVLTGRLLTASRTLAILALLVLNYSNAAAAAPQLVTGVSPGAAVVVSMLSILMCGLVFLSAYLCSRRLTGDDSRRRAGFVYVTGMKNTGAGLVLATSLLAHEPIAILVPIFYTIAQHLAAAITDRRLALKTPVKGRQAMPNPVGSATVAAPPAGTPPGALSQTSTTSY